MQSIFLDLVKLSLIGSLFAAAVMLVRLIFRKAPKWLFCVLWGVVALRLIFPVSIESNVSLVPDRLASGQIITNVGNEYIGDVDIIYESNAGYSNAIEAGRQPIYSNDGYYVVTEKDSLEAPKTVGQTVYPVLSWIWVAGMILMLAYTAVSYLLLRKKMEEATQLRDNIWQCEQVDSPFVLGLIKPRIYLPYAITDSDMANVIAHEQAHIQRKDHWWKPIGFLLLSIHWFNPVLWLAYVLLCRDIEAACDEKVIKYMAKDEMRAYSTALLHCSVHRRRIAACPLAFGETGVKERIKRVMNYKKPAFWIILLALVASIAVCILLLTNPVAKNTTLMGANYKVTEVLYSTADEDDDRYSRFMITADYVLYAQLEGDETWCIHKKMEAYPLTAKELQKYTANKNGWKENYRIKEITDAYIYRAENDWFYLAAQTKNGDTLIGIGWEDVSERGQGASDDTYLRYLYKVESEFTENEFNVNFFVHSLYEALGVTDCFEAYTNEDNPGFIVVGFMSDYNDQAEHDYNDMGFAVFQSQNNGYRLLDYHVYENAANQNEGILFCDHPAVMSLDGSMYNSVTFDVIISCNTKLDKIQREYYKDDKLSKQIASTHLGGGKSMTLFRWDEMVGSNIGKQYYLDSEGNEIAFEEYGEAVNYDNLIAMVQDIAHNPDCAASSNPFDYIEAKRALYNEIISYGSSTVDCFVEQLRSGENGLQGYIMAVACADITGIGDKDLGADWGNAQEWLALYDEEETAHNHTPAEKRQADSFIVHAEVSEITDYIICYQEPDGCITPVATMGNYEQPFMIHDNLIFYVERKGGCRLSAIDFAGNVYKEYQLEETLDQGWIVFSDDKYIYGAAGDATSNANYIFQADWDLTDCKQISAFPKQFRQFDYKKVGKDFAKLCQADISKIYLHGANVLFDANGMAYEMFLKVSAVTESEIISGNLLLSWYNQHPSYDTWDMNPWFNKVDEGYGSTEGLMTLSDFLNQLKGMEDASVVPNNLPTGTKPFRLTYGIGTPEELPTAEDASKVYMDLTTGTPNTIADPDTSKNYFSIASKDNNEIIGTLYILAN